MVVFLEILYKTRDEVYTVDVIQSAWRASKFWPIDIDNALRNYKNTGSTTISSSVHGSSSTPAHGSSFVHDSNSSPDVLDKLNANPTMDTPRELR